MTNTNADPIRADWKVSHVLSQYPQLRASIQPNTGIPIPASH